MVIRCLLLPTLLLLKLSNAVESNAVALLNADRCVQNIQFIPELEETQVKWSIDGYTISDSASGGVTFQLIISSHCDLGNDSIRIGLTGNSTVCGPISVYHTLSKVEQDVWATVVTISRSGHYYLCLSVNDTEVHQGDGPFSTFQVHLEKNRIFIPVWLRIILIIICQTLAALLSGLNLGLLTLDLSDLKVLRETGSYREKYFASRIFPLRKRANYLLCSIVLGQTLCNAINTLNLDSLAGGVVATIMATLMITIFGEIIPQAVCSRYGLLIGAVTAPITWIVMAITAPLSWTFGKILDKVLGTNPPIVYTRERISFLLRELVSDLDVTEKRMVEGVLSLRNKPVKEHMTKLKDVFMVNSDDRFNDHMFMSICESGYSRIPVYKEKRENIVGVMHVKDLALLDTSQPRTIGKICEAFNLPYDRCKDDLMMSELLHDIQNQKLHMLIVERDLIDLTSEAVGVITLEDIIEALLSWQIMDEYDRNEEEKVTRTFSWRNNYDRLKIRMPSQFKSGAVQFLSSLEPFSDKRMSVTVLCRLVQKGYVDKTDQKMEVFFKRGKESENFMLILSGSMIIEAGVEKLKFEAGPYCHFGEPALAHLDLPYVPDFSAYTDQPLKYIWLSKSDLLDTDKPPIVEEASVTEGEQTLPK